MQLPCGSIQTTADDFHFTLDSEEIGAALRPVAWVNLALLLALAGLVFAFCVHLGAGIPAAALGAALIAINPRLGYYVATLWPELLHAVLLSGALLGLSQAVDLAGRGRRLGYGLAAASGLLVGYATLTKGVAGTFFGLVSLAVACWALWRLRADRRSAARLMIALALFVVSAQAVVLPQRLANRSRIGAPIIATNFWLNVEVGLGSDDLDAGAIRRTYFGASRDFLERETLSRARVRSYLSGVDPARLALRLAAKLKRVVSSSFLAKSRATKRWDGIDEEDLGSRSHPLAALELRTHRRRRSLCAAGISVAIPRAAVAGLRRVLLRGAHRDGRERANVRPGHPTAHHPDSIAGPPSSEVGVAAAVASW